MNILPREAPLLPLDEWRRIMGLNPFAFWQLGDDDKLRINSACSPLVFQYAWQNANALGRAEIADAIMSAEQKLKLVLGYSVAPDYEADELQFPEHYDPRLAHLSATDQKGRWLALQTKRGHVQALGAVELSHIGNASVTLADADGDGVDDTFTLSIATTVTDATELAVYFVTADRFDGADVSERWRVQPVRASISSGTATIKGRAWTIVRPVKHEGVTSAALDPAVIGVLASSLAVYRRRPAPDQHGALVWETIPDGCYCDTSMVTTDPAGNTTQTARYQVRNSERGWIAGEAASYDSGAGEWSAAGWAVGYPPQKLRVNYLAGYPLVNGEMPEWMKVMVARMAAAELGRKVCGCDDANGNVAHWQVDLSEQGGDKSYFVAQGDLNNPFGTRRGHVDAWREIRSRELELIRGVAAF